MSRKPIHRYEKGTMGRCRNSTSVARCGTEAIYTPREEEVLQAAMAFKTRTGKWPCMVEMYHIIVDELGYKR